MKITFLAEHDKNEYWLKGPFEESLSGFLITSRNADFNSFLGGGDENQKPHMELSWDGSENWKHLETKLDFEALSSLKAVSKLNRCGHEAECVGHACKD